MAQRAGYIGSRRRRYTHDNEEDQTRRNHKMCKQKSIKKTKKKKHEKTRNLNQKILKFIGVQYQIKDLNKKNKKIKYYN